MPGTRCSGGLMACSWSMNAPQWPLAALALAGHEFPAFCQVVRMVNTAGDGGGLQVSLIDEPPVTRGQQLLDTPSRTAPYRRYQRTATEINLPRDRKPARTEAGPGAVTGPASSQPRSTNATVPGGLPGMNIEVAADLGVRIAAIGPVPVPGGRHDAHAGLKDLLAAPMPLLTWATPT